MYVVMFALVRAPPTGGSPIVITRINKWLCLCACCHRTYCGQSFCVINFKFFLWLASLKRLAQNVVLRSCWPYWTENQCCPSKLSLALCRLTNWTDCFQIAQISGFCSSHELISFWQYSAEFYYFSTNFQKCTICHCHLKSALGPTFLPIIIFFISSISFESIPSKKYPYNLQISPREDVTFHNKWTLLWHVWGRSASSTWKQPIIFEFAWYSLSRTWPRFPESLHPC